MANGFVKIYGSKLLTSSVWSASKETRLVWITLLAMADADGIVDCWLPGLAKAAGVTLEEAAEAFDYLNAPDPHSRTIDHEGRRVRQLVDNGQRKIRILNHGRYRDHRSPKQVKAAERQKRYREKKKAPRGVTGDARYAPDLRSKITDPDPPPTEEERTIPPAGPCIPSAVLFARWEKAYKAATGKSPPGIPSPRRLGEAETMARRAPWAEEVSGFAAWAAHREALGKDPMVSPWSVFREDYGTWDRRVERQARRLKARAKAEDEKDRKAGRGTIRAIPDAEETERKLAEQAKRYAEEQEGNVGDVVAQILEGLQ